jgi:hypothetical protein
MTEDSFTSSKSSFCFPPGRLPELWASPCCHPLSWEGKEPSSHPPQAVTWP